MWISLINTHASVRTGSQGKAVSRISTSAERPPLMFRCVSMEPHALMAKDRTSHAGEFVHYI